VKTKTLDEMADFEVLAVALEDMELLGLIRWKPDADEKPAFVRKPQGQEQHAITNKVAA
jgi:hypothetical protein